MSEKAAFSMTIDARSEVTFDHATLKVASKFGLGSTATNFIQL